jgi:antitoxin component YwqK of YwqJK toxin-antitoxin module
MASHATRIAEVKTFEERYPSGKPKATWAGGVADDGRFLRHGAETWHYEDGSKQWEVTYDLGRKRGAETYWSRDGRRLWSRDHRADGTSTWTQWWPGGGKKAESTWRGSKADGLARRWQADGTLAAEMRFETGRPAAARSARGE